VYPGEDITPTVLSVLKQSDRKMKYFTFFQSRGFVKTTGTILALRGETTDDSTVYYYPTVEYSVDGITYDSGVKRHPLRYV